MISSKPYFGEMLVDHLPKTRGRSRACVPLCDLTWFRVGGPAEVTFKPADLADLSEFLRLLPEAIPVTVLGVGSNLLVREGGIPGVVIRLGRSFTGISIQDDDIIAGAGALDVNVALTCAENHLEGLEFLSGIPGTIGGALRMNAGAYGREMEDVVESAEALDRSGKLHKFTGRDLGFGYRSSSIPSSFIFTSARLKSAPGKKEEILSRMNEIRGRRENTQPTRTRTGGSTFKNPPNCKAWELVRDAGCAGLSIGAAQVSNQHANFLINNGGASADDLESLGLEVVKRVKQYSGVILEWEIHRIGMPEGQGPKSCEGGI